MAAASARRIGPVLATFVVANNMIGAGFFLLPATLARSGSVTWMAWLVGTALAVVLGGAFARLARAHPGMTCADDYVRPALGRDAGFLAATVYWLASWIGNNAIAVAAFGYLATLLPVAADQPGAQLAGQLALIWLVFALNLLGPRQVARFQGATVLLGLLPVLAVLLFGWQQFDPATFAGGWNRTADSDAAVVLASLAPVFWAFVGLESGAMIAGVVRDPDRNVPRATLAGIVLAGTVYVLASVLLMGIVPAAELAGSSAPLALVAGQLFGPAGLWLVAAAAAVKATGTLGGWMLVSGETGARAAARGFLPWPLFGPVRRNGAAGRGLLVIALGMSAVAALTSAPTVGEQFGRLVGMVVLLVVIAYAAAGLSLLVGSPERPASGGDRLYGAGALAACGLLLFSAPWSMLAGALAATAAVWLAWRLTGRRRAPPLPRDATADG